MCIFIKPPIYVVGLKEERALIVSYISVWPVLTMSGINYTKVSEMEDNGTHLDNLTAVLVDTNLSADEAFKWTDAFVIILGLVTNSLTLSILSKKQIGSK